MSRYDEAYREEWVDPKVAAQAERIRELEEHEGELELLQDVANERIKELEAENKQLQKLVIEGEELLLVKHSELAEARQQVEDARHRDRELRKARALLGEIARGNGYGDHVACTHTRCDCAKIWGEKARAFLASDATRKEQAG